MASFIDVSHTIEHGLITYRGLPAPLICDYLSREESKKLYEPGTTFQIGKIEMVSNTGTYLDCPFHRYEEGKDLSELALANLADLEGIMIRADHKETLRIDSGHSRNENSGLPLSCEVGILKSCVFISNQPIIMTA